MDLFKQIRNRQKNIKISNILNFSPLTHDEKNHLTKVYGLLAFGTILASLSCYIDIFYFKLPRILATIISIICSFALAFSSNPYMSYNSNKRLLYFFGISISLGILISDYVKYVNYLNPAILPVAYFGSLSIFCAFSLASIFSKNRFSLFLGTILFSLCSYVTLISFMNFFIKSRLIDNTLLYVGFFMYIGFVIFDTQVTLFEFRRGNKDFIMHSLCLYLDLVGIFINTLQILGQKEEKKKK